MAFVYRNAAEKERQLVTGSGRGLLKVKTVNGDIVVRTAG